MVYDIPLYQHFLFALIATCGFSVFFNVPPKHLPAVSFIGAIGWMVYIFVYGIAPNPGYSSFCAAAVVSLLGEIFARKLKQPAILFVISGILPLVPGLTLYNMMLNIVMENHSLAARKGADALLIGSGIALGILIVTSLARTFNVIKLKLSIRKNAQERFMYFMGMGLARSRAAKFDSVRAEIEGELFEHKEDSASEVISSMIEDDCPEDNSDMNENYHIEDNSNIDEEHFTEEFSNLDEGHHVEDNSNMYE